jgi:hypothetical protein
MAELNFLELTVLFIALISNFSFNLEDSHNLNFTEIVRFKPLIVAEETNLKLTDLSIFETVPGVDGFELASP